MPATFNRMVLAKAETTYATPNAPAGTDALQVGNDLKLNPLQLGLVDRDLLYPFVGNRGQLVAQKLAQISFSFELVGSGTAGTAPKTGVLLRAAGYSETIVTDTSVTYAPIGTGYEGLTIDCHHGGKRHRLTGTRGNITVEGSVGGVLMGKFDGLGFYNTVSDQSNPTPTYSAHSAPLIINSDNTATVSIQGYAACLESFSLNGGRSPQLHQRAGCSKEIRIDLARNPEGSLMIESPTIAAKDYFAACLAQTEATISFTHGATAGNIVAFTSTSALGEPEYDDADGVEMLSLPFRPIPTITNGYDDHSFIFT